MMRLVHTVIASRATLHSILNKITMLVHKGLFDKSDLESLKYLIDERLLQVRSSKLTVGVSHSSLHTNRYRVVGTARRTHRCAAAALQQTSGQAVQRIRAGGCRHLRARQPHDHRKVPSLH